MHTYALATILRLLGQKKSGTFQVLFLLKIHVEPVEPPIADMKRDDLE